MRRWTTGMTINKWRGVCAGLVVLLLFQFYLIIALRPAQFFSANANRIRLDHQSWSYDPDRDSGNTALSSFQCDQAFPKLYHEIERSVAYWKAKGHTITKNDIDITGHPAAAFNVLIHENQISITGHSKTWMRPFWRTRSLFLLSQLHRALQGATIAGETLPTVEFSPVVGDRAALPEDGATRSFLSLTRRLGNASKEALWLVPDFNFFAGPPNETAWTRMQSAARKHDSPIDKKIPKLAWRGVSGTNTELRGGLLDTARGKDWADVEEMNWKDKANFVDMDDHCRYMFLVYTEGVTYSSRLKHLLNCRSVPFIHDLEFTEFFSHLLVPEGPQQNFVPVKRDWSDLEQKVQQLLEDRASAQRIADNAIATFRERYTSPAAEACYWRKLVRGYSEVAYTPDPYKEVSIQFNGKVETKKILRGDTFEKILLLAKKAPKKDADEG